MKKRFLYYLSIILFVYLNSDDNIICKDGKVFYMQENRKKGSKIHVLQGIQYGSIYSGIKSTKTNDLTLVQFETEATVAGIFTQNSLCAAPVIFCKKNLKNKKAKLLLVNSGNANAATGKSGYKDLENIVSHLAKKFSVQKKEIFYCSTGKIGERLPVEKIKKGIEILQGHLSKNNFLEAAQGICTTDQYLKTENYKGKIAGKEFNIQIMAKGAGMIEPNMATMLCYIFTDLKLSQSVMQKLLKEACDETLNALSVDGDSSTNDTVLMFATGKVKNNSIKLHTKDYERLKSILIALLKSIAFKIALDGEGATKCMHLKLLQGKSNEQAKNILKAIGNSLLVKTALLGADPNWGRIYCAIGYSGEKVLEKRLKIKIGNSLLFSGGKIFTKNISKANHYMKKNKIIDISIDLGMGKVSQSYIASDISQQYVNFNSEYTT